jgi:pimeloyl-ACP methyl ester carboxylesterase
MSFVLWGLFIFAGVGIGLWLLSFAVETLRPVPKPPDKLRWLPETPIQYVEVGGNRLRFIRAGAGPSLVLLHTLRTQLDLFAKVIPELSQRFTVYALDYPGHGYSDIPRARYDTDFFTDAVEGFLDKLDIRNATLVGVSIGGPIALLIAARHNLRVARVIAINPYDYAKGRGMARSSFLGWLVTYASLVPAIGETVMRLRNFVIMKIVLRGGVAQTDSIPPALLEEMYLVGNRRGHYRAFLSLLRNAHTWENSAKDYGRIRVPVLIVWGDEDWAKPGERDRDGKLVPGAETVVVAHGGHFLPLDRPQELIELIDRFERN